MSPFINTPQAKYTAADAARERSGQVAIDIRGPVSAVFVWCLGGLEVESKSHLS